MPIDLEALKKEIQDRAEVMTNHRGEKQEVIQLNVLYRLFGEYI